MSTENGKRYPSWPWLAGVLLLIVVGLTGTWANDKSDRITTLEQNAVTRQEFERLSDNVDRILQLMLDRQGYRPDNPGPR